MKEISKILDKYRERNDTLIDLLRVVMPEGTHNIVTVSDEFFLSNIVSKISQGNGIFQGNIEEEFQMCRELFDQTAIKKLNKRVWNI